MKYIFLIIFGLIGCAHKEKLNDLTGSKCFKNFCVYKIGENPNKTIWYFPGFLDSKKSLEKGIFDTKDVNTMVEGLAPTWVVVYSEATIKKPAWFVKSSKNIKEADTILKQFPAIQKPYYAIGHSMGGLALSSFSILDPNFFEKIILVNPMVLTIDDDPWKMAGGPAGLIRANYTKKEWNELSPSKMLFKVTHYPKTLVSSCSNDIFGLHGPAISLYGALRINGFDAQFEHQPLPCNHSSFSEKRYMEFINE